MEVLGRWVAARAGLVVGVAVVLTLLALQVLVDRDAGRLRISFDTSMDRLLPGADPATRLYHEARQLFGMDAALLVAVHRDVPLAAEELPSVEATARRMAGLAGVRRVDAVHRLLDDLDAVDAAEIERALADAPVGMLAKDRRTLGFLVHLDEIPESELLERDFSGQLFRIAQQVWPGAQIWITGMPHFKAANVELLSRQLLVSVPLVMLVIGLLLIVVFRSVSGVVLPLVAIGLGVLWTLAIVERLGMSLNIITVMVPPLLMTLGFTYSVHVVTGFEETGQVAADRRVGRLLGHVGLPVLLTGLTTLAGLVALLVSPLAAVREFGLIAGIGVCLTTLLSLTLVPALLQLLAPRVREARIDHPFDRFAERVANFDVAYRRWIFFAAGFVVVAALAGAGHIRIESDLVSNLDPGHPVRLDLEAVNSTLGSASTFSVIVRGSHNDALARLDNLRAIAELEEWLRVQPGVSATLSLVGYLTQLQSKLYADPGLQAKLPDSQSTVSQFLLMGAGEDLDSLVDRRFRTGNIIIHTSLADPRSIEALVQEIEGRLESLPEELTGMVSGELVLLPRTVDAIIKGQMTSILLALIIVYGILVAMFLSFRVGLVALIPNLLPVVAYFGMLGLLGITLNPATSLIAPIVLGVAIDDTIHYFERFNRHVKALGDERRATVLALQGVGRPVTYTSIGLVLGFLALTVSDVRMQAELGVMGAIAIAIAWLSDFLLTPALSSSVRIVTLWDALTLDLGENPQKSIPLLNGLTNTQARIVALMASIRDVPAGQRIIRSGDRGDEMYVVIDGRLQASAERDGRRIPLNTHGRGDLVGEVGLLCARRSADVDVIEDARLMRITNASLQRLGRRYPRIAARIQHNLNKILAERLVKATDRLHG